MSNSGLCIFGEVLYDCFPDGASVLGGAPFNVAWHAQAFGLEPLFVSRVGNDPAGDSILAAMRNWGMSLAGMQQDSEHPTGKVQVSFAADGEPAYDIVSDSAWDFIDPAAVPRPGVCGLLYHGTLALRQPVSREAAAVLSRQVGDQRLVDINLRAPWWDSATVQGQLTGARGVKLNRDELLLLAPAADSLEAAVDLFMTRHAPGLLIVTLGAEGAMAGTPTGAVTRVEPVRGSAVVDTVGAGDAFMAVVLLGVVRGWAVADTLRRAQTFASAIVGVRGATVNERAFYQPFLESWELT